MPNNIDLKERVQDYLDGVLSNQELRDFEAALQNDRELAQIVQARKELLLIERAVGNESFDISPDFCLKVMERIEHSEKSFISEVRSWFSSHRSFSYGFSTAAVALVALFIIRPLPNSSREVRPVSPVNESGEPAKSQTKAVSSSWNFDPFILSGPDGTAPGLAALSDDRAVDRLNEITQVLNTFEQPFPSGSGSPVAISYELVRSPSKEDELLLRFSLSGSKDAVSIAAQDLTVDILFDTKVKLVMPIASSSKKWLVVQPGPFTLVKGEKLLAGQQFSSILKMRQLNNLNDTKLLTLEVSYKDPRSNLPQRQSILITADEIVALSRSHGAAYYSPLFD